MHKLHETYVVTLEKWFLIKKIYPRKYCVCSMFLLYMDIKYEIVHNPS